MSAISEETVRKKCELEPWCRQTRNFVSFGKAPAWLENISDLMPADSTEKQDYKDAAKLAREIYRQQALQMVNPVDVVKLCRDEPWTTAQSVDRLDNGVFGYMTEKLESARDLFDKDSPEYQAYDDAFEKAKLLYFASIHEYSKRYAQGKTRAEIEEINVRLWSKANTYEDDGTFRRSRMIKLCELMSDYQRGLNKPPANDPTKAQVKASANSFWENGPGPG